MKKIYCLFLAFALFVTVSFPSQASNNQSYIVSTEDLGNGYCGITTIEISNISPMATGHKTGSKTYEIRNSSGDVVAVFKLTASFTYNTSGTVTCDSATYSTTINKSGWSFPEASAYKSGKTAYGEFVAKYKILGITINTIEKTITLTCDSNGNLS